MAEDEDDDSVSLTSTSPDDEEEEYTIEKILAEKEEDGVRKFLIKWEGYGDERSTWEPEDNLTNESLRYWREDYDINVFGDDDEADEVERKMQEYELAKLERRRRRQLKRARLNRLRRTPHQVQEDKDDGADREQEDSSDDGAPIPQTRVINATQSNPLTRELTDRVRPALSSITTQQQQKKKKTTNLSPTKKSDTSDLAIGRSDHQYAIENDRTGPKKKGAFSVQQLDTSETTDISRRGPSWIQDYRASGRGIRLNKAKSGNPPGPNLLRTQQLPDKEALQLRPAEQWSTTSDLKNYPISSRSNIEASRLWAPPPVRQPMNSTDGIQSTHEETAALLPQPESTEASPVTPMKRNTDEPLLDSKRPRIHEPNASLPEIKRTPEGLWWYKGEILVHLLLHNESIGSARFQGFDGINWLFSAIVRSRVPQQLRLDLNFNLIKVDQFRICFRGMSWSPYTTGCVVACEIFEESITSFVKRLEDLKEAAYCNLTTSDVTLFLYSPKTPEWQFLRQNAPNQYSNAILLIVATKAMRLPVIDKSNPIVASRTLESTNHSEPPMDNPQLPNSTIDPTRDPRLNSRQLLTSVTDETSAIAKQATVVDSRNAISDSTPTSPIADLSTRRSSATLIQTTNRSLTQTDQQCPTNEALVNVIEEPAKISPPPADIMVEQMAAKRVRNKHPEERISYQPEAEDPFLRVKNPDENNRYFKDHYDITFEELLRGETPNPRLRIFYLLFDPYHKQEHKYWKRFLEGNWIAPNNIYDTGPKDWHHFLKMFRVTSNTNFFIIVHENEAHDYEKFLDLANMLMGDKSVKMYKTRLAGRFTDNSTSRLVELFPAGGAILLTEATMVQDPDLSLAIIRWFIRQVENRENGTWKLYMRPRVNVWLMNKVKSSQDSVLSSKYVDMLIDIARLFPLGKAPLLNEMPPSLHVEGDHEFDGTTTPDGHPCHIVSPASLEKYDAPSTSRSNISQETRNEHWILEFFSASAILRATSLREWYAITPIHLKQWKAFQHIKIMPAQEFCTKMQIEEWGKEVT